MCSIFQELQIVHDTGYFSALPSLEEYWQQVNISSLHLYVKAEPSTFHATCTAVSGGPR